MRRLLPLLVAAGSLHHAGATQEGGPVLTVAITEPFDSFLVMGPSVRVRASLSLAGDLSATALPMRADLCAALHPLPGEKAPGPLVPTCLGLELAGGDGTVVATPGVESGGWYKLVVEVVARDGGGGSPLRAAATSRVFLASEAATEPTCVPVVDLGEATAVLYRGATGGKPDDSGTEPVLLGIAWKIGGGYGWGTAGLNVALASPHVLAVPLYSAVPDGLSPAQAVSLRPALRRGAAVSRNLFRDGGATVRRPWRDVVAFADSATSGKQLVNSDRGTVKAAAAASAAEATVGAPIAAAAEVLEEDIGTVVQLPFPVVHCLGTFGTDYGVDTILGAFSGGLSYWGTVNIGVIFAEAVAFTARDVALLRRFDAVLAGSRWNRGLLVAAGLPQPRVGLFLQGVDHAAFDTAAAEAAAAAGNSAALRADMGLKAMATSGDGAAGTAFLSGEDGEGAAESAAWLARLPEKRDGEFWIFSGGKLEFRKGQDIVIATFRLLRAQFPGVRLAVVWANRANRLTENHKTIAYSPHVRGFPRRFGLADDEHGSVGLSTEEMCGGSAGAGSGEGDSAGRESLGRSSSSGDGGTGGTKKPLAAARNRRCGHAGRNENGDSGDDGDGPVGDMDVVGWLAANGVDPADVVDLGPVPHAAVPALLRGWMDAALFPNRCEGGTNLVAMEAVAAGVPTVLSANTGHLDLIAHVGADLLWPVYSPDSDLGAKLSAALRGCTETDPREVAKAVAAVLADPVTAAARAAAAAERMRAWGWEGSVELLVETTRRAEKEQAAAAAAAAAAVLAAAERRRVGGVGDAAAAAT